LAHDPSPRVRDAAAAALDHRPGTRDYQDPTETEPVRNTETTP
jgi:hypothetical protein